MDRPKNAGQKLFGGRLALQLYEFLVQAVQVFIAFAEKFLNDVVHRGPLWLAFCLYRTSAFWETT
jgi:hypothetical protein